MQFLAMTCVLTVATASQSGPGKQGEGKRVRWNGCRKGEGRREGRRDRMSIR